MSETSLSEASLLARISAAPRLPARGRAVDICRKRLLDHLDDGPARQALSATLAAAPAAMALVAGLLAHSPFLTRIMRRHPEYLLESLAAPPEARAHALVARLRLRGDVAASIPEHMSALRRLRAELALLVALADCGGIWSVDKVVEVLTATADAALNAALEISLRDAAQAGRLHFDGAGPLAPRCGLTILAMGKHGAGELNYSSDIDIILLYDPALIPASRGGEPLDAFARVAKDIVKLLQEPTGEGHVFRVDLRLRPDPASTPVAMTLGAALAYYESVGQNWERAALIKARPVAGDLALGQRALGELQPFIWRKYFDYGAIADIHAMKRQIHAHKGHETIAIEGHDIKLGRGGIREIEFFVQTQQLVFGGRRPHLRGARTLETLQALQADGWISARAVQDLTAAYRFLRMVEHRLQMLEDAQTQRLPHEPEAIDAFGRFCGFAPARFRHTLTHHLRRVENHYARLFEHAPELSTSIGNLVFTGVTDDPETLATLRKLGFRRPELVAETIRGWHFGRRPGMTTPRARETLTELTPSLLEAMGQSSDPDGALIALDEALTRMPAAAELFSILKSNSALRHLFAEILGSAPRLSEVVSRYPHVLDAVVDPAFTQPGQQVGAVAGRVAAAIGTTGTFEDFLDRLRYAKRAETFVTGAQMLSGIVPPVEAGASFSAIADAVVAAALSRVLADFETSHGVLQGGSFAVLALGKLGSRELTATSDLDLLFIYDHPEDVALSSGARPLYPADWFARLAQRLVSALTVPTRAGTLYDVDLRLRPDGKKGPIAVRLGGFEAYQASKAETWEHMALTRLRFVAGSETLGAAAIDAARRIIQMPRNSSVLAKDVAAMRALVAGEKGDAGPFDLKLAPGGLFDIEFMAQHAVLALGPRISPGPDTVSMLRQAGEAGHFNVPDTAALTEAWRLQATLQQTLRLCLPEGKWSAAAPAALRKRLATTLGLPDFRIVERELLDTQRNVRAMFFAYVKAAG